MNIRAHPSKSNQTHVFPLKVGLIVPVRAIRPHVFPLKEGLTVPVRATRLHVFPLKEGLLLTQYLRKYTIIPDSSFLMFNSSAVPSTFLSKCIQIPSISHSPSAVTRTQMSVMAYQKSGSRTQLLSLVLL